MDCFEFRIHGQFLTAKVRPKKDNKVWPNDDISNNALYVLLKSDLDFKQTGLWDRFINVEVGLKQNNIVWPKYNISNHEFGHTQLDCFKFRIHGQFVYR
jgi:hypothetical protein